MKDIIKLWLKDHDIDLADERIEILETMLWNYIKDVEEVDKNLFGLDK